MLVYFWIFLVFFPLEIFECIQMFGGEAEVRTPRYIAAALTSFSADGLAAYLL